MIKNTYFPSRLWGAALKMASIRDPSHIVTNPKPRDSSNKNKLWNFNIVTCLTISHYYTIYNFAILLKMLFQINYEGFICQKMLKKNYELLDVVIEANPPMNIFLLLSNQYY
jgi:hypothetical protein